MGSIDQLLLGSTSSFFSVVSAARDTIRRIVIVLALIAVAVPPRDDSDLMRRRRITSCWFAAAVVVIAVAAVEFVAVPRILEVAAPLQHVQEPPQPAATDATAAHQDWVCPPRFVCVSASSLLRAADAVVTTDDGEDGHGRGHGRGHGDEVGDLSGGLDGDEQTRGGSPPERKGRLRRRAS